MTWKRITACHNIHESTLHIWGAKHDCYFLSIGLQWTYGAKAWYESNTWRALAWDETTSSTINISWLPRLLKQAQEKQSSSRQDWERSQMCIRVKSDWVVALRRSTDFRQKAAYTRCWSPANRQTHSHTSHSHSRLWVIWSLRWT